MQPAGRIAHQQPAPFIRRFGDGGVTSDSSDDAEPPPQGAPWPGVQEIEIGLGQVGELPDSIEAMVGVPDGKLTDVAGIGKDLAEKITTLVETGSLPMLDELLAVAVAYQQATDFHLRRPSL